MKIRRTKLCKMEIAENKLLKEEFGGPSFKKWVLLVLISPMVGQLKTNGCLNG